MKNNAVREFIVATCLLSGMWLCSAANDSDPVPKSPDGKGLPAAPRGVAPLAGVAVALVKDADDSRKYAWSLKLQVPKVVWEVTGKESPKQEWTRVKADVEMLTLVVDMGYSEATQLTEQGQNRLVDLNGKRLSREEALKRLGENTPVLVSVSGEMPDPFYLQSSKRDTLIVLFGLPSSREYNLLPTSRGDNRQAAQDGGGKPANRPGSE